jgi:hypothetical protein
VPGRGLEPLRIAPPDPKSGASANFATLALRFQIVGSIFDCNKQAKCSALLTGDKYPVHSDWMPWRLQLESQIFGLPQLSSRPCQLNIDGRALLTRTRPPD